MTVFISHFCNSRSTITFSHVVLKGEFQIEHLELEVDRALDNYDKPKVRVLQLILVLLLLDCRAQDIYHQAAKRTFFSSLLAISLPKPHILLHEEKKIVAIFVTRCNASKCYERNGIFLDILDLMERTFFDAT